MAHDTFFLSLPLTLAAFQGTHAIDYVMNNTAAATAGGAGFDNEIVAVYSQRTLACATNFIRRPSNEPTQLTRKRKKKKVQRVCLSIDRMDGVAHAINNVNHVSANYIGNSLGDVRREINGVLYLEMAQIWQRNRNGQASSGLIEGITDFVRLKADLGPIHWVQQGQGDRWDHYGQAFGLSQQFEKRSCCRT